MPIVQKTPPPAAGPNAIGLALRDLSPPSASAAASGGARINLSKPLPVYTLHLDQLHGRESLQHAKLATWRYLIDDGAAYADVRHAGEDAKFASLSRNPNAKRLAEAAHLAEAIAKDLPDEVEARILEVPALYVSAIWLTGTKPMFIPYIDARARQDEPVRAEPDLLDVLVRLADIARQHLRGGDRADSERELQWKPVQKRRTAEDEGFR